MFTALLSCLALSSFVDDFECKMIPKSSYDSTPCLELNINDRIEKLGKEFFGLNEFCDYSVSSLEGGIVSHVYKIHFNGSDYVFRFAPNWQGRSHFFRECYSSQLMSEKGIAPHLMHASEPLHGWILEYIPSCHGSQLRQMIEKDPYDYYQQQLAKLVRQVHGSTQLQPFQFIYSKAKNIFKNHPHPDRLKEAIDWVSSMEERFWNFCQPKMCHNDLHLGNVLCADAKLYLIDWTSCQMGDPFCDIAKMTYFLPDRERVLFYYLGRAPTDQESAHFEISKSLFDLVIAVNIMNHFFDQGGKTSHEEMERDFQEISPYFDLNPYEGVERCYWNSLRALKRFIMRLDSGELNESLAALG